MCLVYLEQSVQTKQYNRWELGHEAWDGVQDGSSIHVQGVSSIHLENGNGGEQHTNDDLSIDTSLNPKIEDDEECPRVLAASPPEREVSIKVNTYYNGTSYPTQDQTLDVGPAVETSHPG
ncbi:hypothetical protein PG994_001226 [Apiospora phragmitis]|uniref:Uncharacterized protein n=1 Tax=Apiospora phragmitis TaxID=2905665 RepID=A0ABR1WSZ9_9PEZI